MKTSNNNSEKVIAKFHKSRGGRFNNPGFLRFVGFERIDEGTAFESLFYDEDEGIYLDAGGNPLHDDLTEENIKSGIGIINIDHDYDTTFTMYLEDCDHIQLAAIARQDPWNLREVLESSSFFEDNSVLDVLEVFDKVAEALAENYSENTLEYVGIEEISEEEYELYEAFRQEEVNGKFYKLS